LDKKFESVKADENNKKWDVISKREQELYDANTDIRSCFERDYTRILHSNAYRRLKHKTQVFYSPENDHICTRIEHVNYVESISYTISNYLGLNTELAKAIAAGHDVGHSPFGHAGEKVLSEISKRDIGQSFWHERNGLYMVDYIELLEDRNGKKKNLDLTYAVRDGIISHCGEIDENSLYPRTEAIDLEKEYQYPNQYSPYTWEGCVVKISDKISYIGRDIEDAIKLGFISKDLKELEEILGREVNNSIIINTLVRDVCENSSLENGIRLSKESIDLMDTIKDYNYKNIYLSQRMKPSNEFFRIVINQIYETLKATYKGEESYKEINKLARYCPNLANGFIGFIENYWNISDRNELKLDNKILYNINNKSDYLKAIITYISGMTDKFAIDMYNEIIRF